MILLPPDIRFALRANNITHRAAQRDGKPEPASCPFSSETDPARARSGSPIEICAPIFGSNNVNGLAPAVWSQIA